MWGGSEEGMRAHVQDPQTPNFGHLLNASDSPFAGWDGSVNWLRYGWHKAWAQASSQYTVFIAPAIFVPILSWTPTRPLLASLVWFVRFSLSVVAFSL